MYYSVDHQCHFEHPSIKRMFIRIQFVFGAVPVVCYKRLGDVMLLVRFFGNGCLAFRYFISVLFVKPWETQNMTELQYSLGLSDILAIVALVIALLSALIAALSVFYAERALKESKRANEISLSVHRQEIYAAFLELRLHMDVKAEMAEKPEVQRFYNTFHTAKFYLPTDLYEKISAYYQACFTVAHINQSNSGSITTNSMERSQPYIDTANGLAPEIESSLSELIRSSMGS